MTILNFEDYADFVTKLASKDSMKDFNSKLGTGGLGLSGEAGEIARNLYHLFYLQEGWSEDMRKDLLKEAGDIAWYVAFMTRNVLNRKEQDLKNVVGWWNHQFSYSIEPIDNLQFIASFMFATAGDVSDIVKKLLFHGMPYTDDVVRKLTRLLSDMYWSLVYFAIHVLGTDLMGVMLNNVEKLSARYKSLEFSTEEFMAKEAEKTSTL